MRESGASNRLGAGDIVFCSATQMRAPLREKAEAAAKAGFAGVSVSVLDYGKAGMSDAEIRRMLGDLGLRVADIEAMLQWSTGSKQATEQEAGSYFDIAQALGSTSVVAIHLGEEVLPVDRAAESFAHVCRLAAERGLAIHLEFLPWTGIGDLATARAIVEASGCSNGRLVIDSWHLFRSATPPEAVAALPGDLVGAVQLSDAPTERQGSLMEETLGGRLLPGRGDIDLVSLVQTLDEIGSAAPIGVEVISARMNELSAEDAAQQTMAATREVLARARPGSA